MKYRLIYCLLLLAAVITFSGCAEALLAGKVAGGAIYQNSKADVETPNIVEPWKLKETYGGIYKVGNRIEIWAYNGTNSRLIGKTEYLLNLDDYTKMTDDQKKSHVRNYFKNRTGIDLDPSLQEKVPVNELTETKPLKVAPRMPDIPTAGFAPNPQPR